MSVLEGVGVEYQSDNAGLLMCPSAGQSDWILQLIPNGPENWGNSLITPESLPAQHQQSTFPGTRLLYPKLQVLSEAMSELLTV